MRTFHKFFLALALLAAATLSVPAQQPPLQDPLLDHLTGNWVLQGTIAGKPTTHDITASWAIDHHYVAIREVSPEKQPDGKPAYEAMVYVSWNPPTSDYGCVWLDVYGGLAPVSLGTAPHSTSELALLFKDKDSAFHTTFAYQQKTDSWTWKMDNDDNGTLKPFARATLTRAK
jgi:hypothetical protein